MGLNSRTNQGLNFLNIYFTLYERVWHNVKGLDGSFSQSIKNEEEITFYHFKLFPDYTLYPKLFEYTFSTLNYDPCYILHINVKFTVNLDGKAWYNVKWFNCSFSQFIKNKEEITLYLHKLYFLLHFAL